MNEWMNEWTNRIFLFCSEKINSMQQNFTERQIIAQLGNKFPVFYGSSLQCSQKHVIGACSKPSETSAHIYTLSVRFILQINNYE
jgi:hypothetical protein